MVKVRSIELHSYYENTLPTSKYKLIVFTILDSYFGTYIGITLSCINFYQVDMLSKELKNNSKIVLIIKAKYNVVELYYMESSTPTNLINI